MTLISDIGARQSRNWIIGFARSIRAFKTWFVSQIRRDRRALRLKQPAFAGATEANESAVDPRRPALDKRASRTNYDAGLRRVQRLVSRRYATLSFVMAHDRQELMAEAQELQGLDQAVRWGLQQNPRVIPLDVVIQDEFTHDVIFKAAEDLFLVFDAT